MGFCFHSAHVGWFGQLVGRSIRDYCYCYYSFHDQSIILGFSIVTFYIIHVFTHSIKDGALINMPVFGWWCKPFVGGIWWAFAIFSRLPSFHQFESRWKQLISIQFKHSLNRTRWNAEISIIVTYIRRKFNFLCVHKRKFHFLFQLLNFKATSCCSKRIVIFNCSCEFNENEKNDRMASNEWKMEINVTLICFRGWRFLYELIYEKLAKQKENRVTVTKEIAIVACENHYYVSNVNMSSTTDISNCVTPKANRHHNHAEHSIKSANLWMTMKARKARQHCNNNSFPCFKLCIMLLWNSWDSSEGIAPINCLGKDSNNSTCSWLRKV